MPDRVGGQTETGRLRRVGLKHARDAFVSDAGIARQWEALNYLSRPDFARAVAEYEGFVALLQRCDVALEWLPPNEAVGLDSMYVRDVAGVMEGGLIIGNMGKPARATEAAAAVHALHAARLPIRGQITGDGRLEGGDLLWVDERTLAVGRGYRTNDSGIRQLRDLLRGSIDELIVVGLPHWRGPNDVFHLMSIVSPLDRDLFLAYSPLLPVPFREALLARGIDVVEVASPEFATLGCNVLAVAPRQVLAVAGNPETRARLEAAGVTVHEFAGEEICVKGGGGPTCLTRPLLRDR